MVMRHSAEIKMPAMQNRVFKQGSLDDVGFLIPASEEVSARGWASTPSVNASELGIAHCSSTSTLWVQPFDANISLALIAIGQTSAMQKTAPTQFLKEVNRLILKIMDLPTNLPSLYYREWKGMSLHPLYVKQNRIHYFNGLKRDEHFLKSSG